MVSCHLKQVLRIVVGGIDCAILVLLVKFGVLNGGPTSHDDGKKYYDDEKRDDVMRVTFDSHLLLTLGEFDFVVLR